MSIRLIVVTLGGAYDGGGLWNNLLLLALFA